MVRAPARLNPRRYAGGSNMKVDIELQRGVTEELKWEPCVNAAHIGLAAKDILTLTGYISSFAERRRGGTGRRPRRRSSGGIANALARQSLGINPMLRRTDPFREYEGLR
jgi:hypothetical protein